MATHSLMHFFEDVYKKELSYCAVCLRSEKEVRLRAPLVFRKVLGALKYLDSLKNEKVCYVCEARASAVARFVNMVQLSLEIQKSLKNRRKIWRKRVLESMFTKMRTRSQLGWTQVLQVDSAINNNSIESDRMSQLVKMNDKKTPLDIETVIIDDDSPQVNNITPLPNQMDPTGTGNYMYFVPMATVLPTGPVYLVPTTSGNTQPVQENLDNEGKTDTVECRSKKKKSSNLCLPPTDKKSRKTQVIDDDLEIHIEDDDDRLSGNKMLIQMLESEAKVPFRTESRVDWENVVPKDNNLIGTKGKAKLNGKKDKTTLSGQQKNSKTTDTNSLNISNGDESNVHSMPVVTVLSTNSTYGVLSASGNNPPVQELDSESETDNLESNSRTKQLDSKPSYRENIAKLCSPSIELTSTIDKLCSSTIDKLCSPSKERLSLLPSERLPLSPSEGLGLPPPKGLCPPLMKSKKMEVIDDDIEIVPEDDDTLEPQVIKAPIRTDSRVDWEDVIPMELIACAEDKPSTECNLSKVRDDLLKDLEIVINMGEVIK